MVPLPPYYFEVTVIYRGGWFDYCDDEWVRGPSGALCVFHPGREHSFQARQPPNFPSRLALSQT